MKLKQNKKQRSKEQNHQKRKYFIKRKQLQLEKCWKKATYGLKVIVYLDFSTSKAIEYTWYNYIYSNPTEKCYPSEQVK